MPEMHFPVQINCIDVKTNNFNLKIICRFMLEPVLKREGVGTDSAWKLWWQYTLCCMNKITSFLWLLSCMHGERYFPMYLWLHVSEQWLLLAIASSPCTLLENFDGLCRHLSVRNLQQPLPVLFLSSLWGISRAHCSRGTVLGDFTSKWQLTQFPPFIKIYPSCVKNAVDEFGIPVCSSAALSQW